MTEQEPVDATLIVRLLQEFSIASERSIDALSIRYHLHRTDLHALDHLLRAEQAGNRLTASTLGRALGLTPAATTALIDRLHSAGHAERVRDTRDRRIIHVVMTEKAKEDCWQMFSPLAHRLAAAADSFTTHEQTVLASFLTAAIAAVDDTTSIWKNPTGTGQNG